ncbi:hypothetical protein P9112_006048 [Eukaryota sp. TZLM1-RC]
MTPFSGRRPFRIPSEDVQIDWDFCLSSCSGSASVYFGSWQDTQVAIKTVTCNNQEHRLELQSALIPLSRLPQHQSVLPVLGVVWLSDYRLGIVMEKGEQLSPTMTLSTKLKHCLEVAEGLQFLHTHNITHTQIKPANVLLVHDHAKLTDVLVPNVLRHFTVQKFMEPLRQHYNPPEFPTVCPQSDVYSFGLVFFEVLFNRSVFDGLELLSIIKMKMNDVEFDFPNFDQLDAHDLNFDTYSKLTCLLSDCCRRNSSERCSVDHIVSTLGEIVEGTS